MTRDPFYQAIVRQLEDGVDPELFERCAADILGDEWPTLVPVRGGGDAGMDGAIGQPGEMPMPMVCTTGTDVIGNLTRSLDSYVAHGGLSRQVISATSQALTPTRRRNLENRASDKGFTLVNIYDQAAFANRLYRNPRWCRELLNIPVDPPAISAVPLSSRPLSGIPLVGRDDAFAWPQATAGDLLIYGQPGIGKTSILLELLKVKDGGFLVDDDQGRILDSIREQQPDIIVVDDAHLASERLTMLDRLRRETGLAFAIVATAWPGSAEQIRTRMGIPIASVKEIGLLTRDEIVQVVRETGVLGPDPLIAEIVNQARGRPGLASTLARLCLRGDVPNVVLGDTLANDVRYSLSPMVSESDLRSIACFGLGGNAGMRTSIVATALGIPLPQLATTIATLSYAGFIEEIGGDADASYAIVPEVLRFALVRDVFYNGPGRLDPTPLIESGNSLDTVARTLVGAASRGASIPQGHLLDVLERAESPSAWRDYAWLGSLQARQMLEQHPEWAALNAEPLLEHIPRLALPKLFELATDDGRPPHHYPDHPLRQIEEWVREALPGSETALPRRATLLNAVRHWAGTHPEFRIASGLVALALSPRFRSTSVDPGAGMTYRWRDGQLMGAELEGIVGLSDMAVETLHMLASPDWNCLFELSAEWSHPYAGLEDGFPETTRAFMRAFACTLLANLGQAPHAGLGVKVRAHRTAAAFGCNVATPIDAEFEVLYPTRNERSEHWYERYEADASGLACEWAPLSPTTIAERLSRFEREAAVAGLPGSGMRTTAILAQALASQVTDLAAWIDAIFAFDLPVDVVIPFLQRGLTEDIVGVTHLSQLVAARPEHIDTAVVAVLHAPNPSDELLETISPWLSKRTWMIELEILRNLIAEKTLRFLLRHADARVASACAFGVWTALSENKIPERLVDEWRAAIRRSPDEGHHLGEILGSNPGLAHDWLRRQILAEEFLMVGSREDSTLALAIDALDADARRCILGFLVGQDLYLSGLVAKLVGNDQALYEWLLDEVGLSRYHLEPIAGFPSELWRERVIAALDHGYAPDEIAAHIDAVSGTGTGPMSFMWSKWIEQFDPYSDDPHPGVQAVVQAFLERMRAELARALIRERNEAIFGWE